MVLQAETRERLRLLIRAIESRPLPAPEPERVAVEAAWDLEALRPPLMQTWDGSVRRATAAGWLTYREEHFDLDGHAVGHQPLASLRHAGGAALGLLSLDGEAGEATLEDLLFLDIETTGLGGAGAMVFLVAVAHVQGSTLRMRQYLAETPAEEGPLLDALLGDIREAIADPVLVTYNGRAFDAPMLDGRATLHRRRAGFESLRHIDMLPPARHLYRGWLPSCRLVEVESRILGVTRPSADVDGAEVPAWYFRFLRSGDMRFVVPIASHNLLDVLSLAALLGRVAAFLEDAARPQAHEALGFGRLLGRPAPLRAIRAYEDALGDLDGVDGCAADDRHEGAAARLETLWRLSLLQKRHGEIEDAARCWRELIRQHGPWSLRAHEELAKFLEHRARDLPGASAVVEGALARLDGGGSGVHRVPGAERWRQVFHHRRDRLTSRIASTISRT
jgi:uncharacterized protein